MKIILPQPPQDISPAWARALTAALQRSLDALSRRQDDLAQVLPAGVVVGYNGGQAPQGWKLCDAQGEIVEEPVGYIIKV